MNSVSVSKFYLTCNHLPGYLSVCSAELANLDTEWHSARAEDVHHAVTAELDSEAHPLENSGHAA